MPEVKISRFRRFNDIYILILFCLLIVPLYSNLLVQLPKSFIAVCKLMIYPSVENIFFNYFTLTIISCTSFLVIFPYFPKTLIIAFALLQNAVCVFTIIKLTSFKKAIFIAFYVVKLIIECCLYLFLLFESKSKISILSSCSKAIKPNIFYLILLELLSSSDMFLDISLLYLSKNQQSSSKLGIVFNIYICLAFWMASNLIYYLLRLTICFLVTSQALKDKKSFLECLLRAFGSIGSLAYAAMFKQPIKLFMMVFGNTQNSLLNRIDNRENDKKNLFEDSYENYTTLERFKNMWKYTSNDFCFAHMAIHNTSFIESNNRSIRVWLNSEDGFSPYAQSGLLSFTFNIGFIAWVACIFIFNVNFRSIDLVRDILLPIIAYLSFSRTVSIIQSSALAMSYIFYISPNYLEEYDEFFYSKVRDSTNETDERFKQYDNRIRY